MNRIDVIEITRQLIPTKIYESGGNLNFRCVICNDSKKSKSKRRGWILFKGKQITYYCFNCNHSQSFSSFVKDRDLTIYNRYFRKKDLEEQIKETFDVKATLITEPENVKGSIQDLSNDILPVSFNLLDRALTDRSKKQLQYKALKMVLERQIPESIYKNFLVCYDKLDDERNFKDRLIIPYYDDKGILYCFQGRTLSKGLLPKYKTHCRDNHKVYNFYHANPDELVLITEGPIDSFFLYNGISTSGAIRFGSDNLKEIVERFPKRAWVFDYDVTGIQRSVEMVEFGETVFCWPKDWRLGRQKVDINEIFVRKNFTMDQINVIVRNNLFKGLKAKVKLL